MQDEATPLFNASRMSSERDKGAPRHRREGHFDDSDQWHDVAEDTSMRSSA